MGGNKLDLALDSREAVKLIRLRCGDLTGDGLINESDMAELFRPGNYNKNVANAASPICDLNGDGLINESDMAILFDSYNYNKGAVIIN